MSPERRCKDRAKGRSSANAWGPVEVRFKGSLPRRTPTAPVTLWDCCTSSRKDVLSADAGAAEALTRRFPTQQAWW